jgi:RNA polymerase sigma factor (sigma-70 family)
VSEALFPSTRHSLLREAQNGDPVAREPALAAVAEAYWKPVYKYIRLKWRDRLGEAQDLTQGFFASLLERDLVARYDPARASFRTYLRTCIDGYVSNTRRSEAARKRGGGLDHLSFDFASAEREVAFARADPESLEDFFYREWQRQMFSLAIDDLRRVSGPGPRFDIFEAYDLAPDVRPTYQELAGRFAVPVTTVTNHLAWARRQLRRLLLDRLASITASDTEFRREAGTLLGEERG